MPSAQVCNVNHPFELTIKAGKMMQKVVAKSAPTDETEIFMVGQFLELGSKADSVKPT